MILYRSEWLLVQQKLRRIKTPTIEMQTLLNRVDSLVQNTWNDPISLMITEYQTGWIERYCHFRTLHQRPGIRGLDEGSTQGGRS